MRKAAITCLSALLFIAVGLQAQIDDTLKIKPSYHEVNFYVDDNEACLKCHGEKTYILEDTANYLRAVKTMGSNMLVDRDAYYTSVHKSFACTDCHDWDFNTFPHPMGTRFQEHLLCMDCHGYDENYAHYNFEGIEMQSQEGIHNDIEGFSCWSCHDPHSYKAFMRNASDMKEAISYDNDMCLSCHADFSKFSTMTDREEIILIESHDWLPSQAAHIRSVRCIECHTEVNDTTFVAHKILAKDQAVRKCAECHSSNSHLMHSLYKHQSKEERKFGFINGVILNDALVIGTNHIPWLDKLSFLILFAAVAGMGLHILLRIINRKKA